MKNFITKNYKEQDNQWPQSGRHIMAHYDDNNTIVYQAYRKEIGLYAAEYNYFSGEFSFSRMSWIKPNFLWMMYRSGWGTKQGQEITLAITIPRFLFDEILCSAVHSTYSKLHYKTPEEWKNAIAISNVRLQWDPDHDPYGNSIERRAIQLGLRSDMLERYARTEVVHIEDISDFVEEQRQNLASGIENLYTPAEKVYEPTKLEAFDKVGIERHICSEGA